MFLFNFYLWVFVFIFLVCVDLICWILVLICLCVGGGGGFRRNEMGWFWCRNVDGVWGNGYGRWWYARGVFLSVLFCILRYCWAMLSYRWWAPCGGKKWGNLFFLALFMNFSPAKISWLIFVLENASPSQ